MGSACVREWHLPSAVSFEKQRGTACLHGEALQTFSQRRLILCMLQIDRDFLSLFRCRGLTSDRKSGQYQYPWRLRVRSSPMQCCGCIETEERTKEAGKKTLNSKVDARNDKAVIFILFIYFLMKQERPACLLPFSVVLFLPFIW